MGGVISVFFVHLHPRVHNVLACARTRTLNINAPRLTLTEKLTNTYLKQT